MMLLADGWPLITRQARPVMSGNNMLGLFIIEGQALRLLLQKKYNLIRLAIKRLYSNVGNKFMF